MPVTDAELDLFEAWFGDLIDEIFAGPALRCQLRCARCGDLP
jgi:hypothetical protein